MNKPLDARVCVPAAPGVGREGEKVNLTPLTNREYRNLRGRGRLVCLKCGKTPSSAWSWDNDPPYSNCCQAPVALTPAPASEALRLPREDGRS